MKQKFLIVLLTLACTLCLALGLSACNLLNSGNETTHSHTNAAAVKKNEIAATCTEDGSYDSVVYCSTCGEEISREAITVPATGHTESTAVKENKVAVTCTTDGSYESVVYCSTCKTEISRETIAVEATGHTYEENWTCTVCNNQLTESTGLAYYFEDNHYYVTGIGTCTDTDIVIPYTHNNFPVTYISSYAFDNLTSITSIAIPNSVTYIGEGAFKGSTSIASVIIGNGVTSIGASAFEDCTSLASITIGNNITSIGKNAFNNTAYYNNTDNWILDKSGGVTYISTIKGILYISNYLIRADLTPTSNYTIKSGTLLIASYAFENCTSISSITIPNSMTSISDYSFYGCTNLKSITIPNSVTSIGNGAFCYCSSLTSITIPDSVTSIGNSAFNNCSSLSSLTIPDSVTSIDIGEWAFSGCTSLTSINIPDSVTSIGDYAFWFCDTLTSITIPDGVTSIGKFSFCYCYALMSITIPDSVTSIGRGAFISCSSLKNVYYSGTQEDWNAITIDTDNYYLTSATITYNGGDTEQGDTEQGDTEQGDTEQGDTEQGSTEQGGTEQGGDTEETFTTYIDKTFEVFSGDMTYYKNDTTEWNGNAAAGFNTSTLTFAFNSDGTGTYYVNYSIGTTNIYEITVTFSYTVSECTVLDVDYTGSTGSFSGSRDFAGYKFTFTNCKFTQYSISGTDYLSSVTDADATTEMSKYAVGYNDSGIYVYGLDLGGVATAAETGTTIAYTMYGKLAEVTN